ncbi:unnamed protein product [Echinostoma caproni]|uniref:C2H2-type domain-containing protein n=1 Tax=Echinostoma caproni TaxID=27848 RepID=A0A183ALW2_9TREM|nr:unnamed protein product [Echinostoma caproni]
MRNLENEYIKSLQQQIYLLELENNYVRQQAANAVDMQPAMIEEASKTLTKIKDLQNRTDSLELELYRKEAHIGILEQKHNRIDQQLKDNLLNHDKETDELKRQLITLRGEREIALRDSLQKDAQLTELRNDLARQKSSLAAAEIQLDLLRAKARLERMQRQLSDCFLTAENDRFVRDKQAANVDNLIQENARLTADLIALQRQADDLEKQERAYDHLLARPSNQPQPPVAQVAQLREDKSNLMNYISNMQQELTRQATKLDELQKRQQQMQEQKQQQQQKKQHNHEKQQQNPLEGQYQPYQPRQQQMYQEHPRQDQYQPQPQQQQSPYPLQQPQQNDQHQPHQPQPLYPLQQTPRQDQQSLQHQQQPAYALQQTPRQDQQQQQPYPLPQTQQQNPYGPQQQTQQTPYPQQQARPDHYQAQQYQQYQRPSSPIIPLKSPLPSPRQQRYGLQSPERSPTETRQASSPVQFRAHTLDHNSTQPRTSSPVVRRGLQFD